MKKIVLLAVLLLLWAGEVRAQCTGYSITSTSVNLLHPANFAAQGNVATTITVSAPDGSSPSHKMTVGGSGGGTPIALNTKMWNASSASVYYSEDNGGWVFWFTLNAGQTNYVTMGSGWIGHVFNVKIVTTGNASTIQNTTQDIINVTTTNQAPGIYSNDGVYTNAYYQLVSNFGGGSMMNNCGECQGGETQKCLLATHTPLFDASLTNPRSGETQTLSNVQAGNVAKAQESVSGTASVGISVLPGDSPTGSTTNKIYCTMFGWVLAAQWNPGLPENEFAITEGETIPSTCAVTLRFFETGDMWGVQCKVAWKKPPATADRCSVASQIPDFNPDTVWDENHCKVPGNCNTSDMPPPNGTNASFPKYWYEASWGIRFGGPPAPGQPDPIINGGAHNWVFPIYLADAYIPGGPDEQWWILDLLNIAVAKGTGLPIDCTNRDKGTSPITSPW